MCGTNFICPFDQKSKRFHKHSIPLPPAGIPTFNQSELGHVSEELENTIIKIDFNQWRVIAWSWTHGGTKQIQGSVSKEGKDKGNNLPAIHNIKNYELVHETYLTDSEVYITYIPSFSKGSCSTCRSHLLIH